MQRYDIAFSQNGVQIGIPDPGFFHFFPLMAAAGQYPCAKSLKELRRLKADSAAAKNPHRAAAYLPAGQPGRGLSFSHGAVTAVYPAQKADRHTDGHLRYAFVGIAGAVADRHAPLAAGRLADMVDPGKRYGQQLQGF